jgi:hypothetical protein
MKIKDLPNSIKERAKAYAKKVYPNKKHRPQDIMKAFDWGETKEGSDYWCEVYSGRFIEAENSLLERLKEENPTLYKVNQLNEDACMNGLSSKALNSNPFFLDEALDVKVNEPEVVPYKDEVLLKEDLLKKIDTGWNTFIPTSNVHTEASKLGSSAVSVINDSFKKAIEIKKDRIVEGVIEKFKSRSEVGIKKYGTTLADNNTDDFYSHLQEELMDAILYLQKIKEDLKDK